MTEKVEEQAGNASTKEIDYSGQISQLLDHWKAVFYQLCEDGIHRPVFIRPTDVMG
jgi:hypothetical protein